MSEAVANIELLNSETDTGTCTAEPEESQTSAGLGKKAGWNPDEFAREQIRGLVRKVFLSGAERSVRQVVFSAVEPEPDVRTVCRWVGEALAEETSAVWRSRAGSRPCCTTPGPLGKVAREKDVCGRSPRGCEGISGSCRRRRESAGGCLRRHCINT